MSSRCESGGKAQDFADVVPVAALDALAVAEEVVEPHADADGAAVGDVGIDGVEEA
jgi:hypothetical protein